LKTLVGPVVGPGGHVLSYQAFIAPALLAASAMNGAIYDSTMNVVLQSSSTPVSTTACWPPSLGPLDVALGEIGWALFRGGLYASGFLVVMAALGLTASCWAILMLPGALLIAFAFGAVGMAVTTYMRSWQDLDLVVLAVLPMFPVHRHVLRAVVVPRVAAGGHRMPAVAARQSSRYGR